MHRLTALGSRCWTLFGWLTGAVFFFYAWVLRVAPSVMVEELMRDFAVGAAVLGHLSAAYFYGYAGMQLPVGVLLDRFGPRRLMTLAALVCAGGCVLFALSSSLAAASAGRFLIGASAAFSLVGSMAVAGQWFHANRFALLSGLSMAMGMAGGVFGQAPLRLAVEAADWRTVTAVLASGGLALAPAGLLLLGDLQWLSSQRSRTQSHSSTGRTSTDTGRWQYHAGHDPSRERDRRSFGARRRPPGQDQAIRRRIDFQPGSGLAEVVPEVRAIAREQDRWIKLASAFPSGEYATSDRGIDGTDWFKIERALYTCLDPYDYRPKKFQPGT